MKEYRVVQSYDIVLFLRDANAKIAEGWKPQGGVHTYLDDQGRLRFIQSMTRRKRIFFKRSEAVERKDDKPVYLSPVTYQRDARQK